MKYQLSGVKIPLPQRKMINEKCLASLDDTQYPTMTLQEVYNSYTGIGGLHGLNYVDYGNYHDFSEAKKEIEQGQFFTSDALCAWVMDCLQPEPKEMIADFTCGKGSFFNHCPVEANLFGCEIEPNSYQIATQLFPKAHIRMGDVRTYSSRISFDLVIGNPPYNISWKYGSSRMSSQAVYILKAAELLSPGGLLAVVVPEAFLGESTPKAEIKRIYDFYNHVVQLSLDPNAFAYLGVRNFPTKLLILQRRAGALDEVPYSPELILCESSEEVFAKYVEPAKQLRREAYPKIRLETNREESNKAEKKRLFDRLLYQILVHPRTESLYQECYRLVEEYQTQKCPDDMSYMDWELKRLRSKNVIKKLKGVLAEQNRVEVDKVELVKGKKSIYYKAYSREKVDEAAERNHEMEMQDINRLIPFGNKADIEKCGHFNKLLTKKQKAYKRQTTPFSEMREDSELNEWLEKWELTKRDENFKEVKVKLNDMQRYDTNLSLQKRYGYLHWSQGSGKTVSGTVHGMYRLEKKQVDYVIVVHYQI